MSPMFFTFLDIDLHILGGFEDDRKLSERLTMELLQEFNSYKPNAGRSVKGILRLV